jgi:hypothetical protein
VDDQIKEGDMGGGDENAHKILIGKFERKKPLGIPSCKQEDNITLYPREMRCENRD